MTGPVEDVRPPLAAAVTTMLSTYGVVILASMALPVLAPLASDTLEVPAHYIGFYTSIMFAGSVVSTLFAADLVRRYGALRLSQGTLVVAAAGLFALTGGTLYLAAASAILIGFAYGPGNTASGWLLSRMTDEGQRSSVFSIKQTGVPLGAALCGLLLPPLALLAGWQWACAAAALACLAMAVAVEPWRSRLDDHRDPGRPLLSANFIGPLRTLIRGPRLRALGLAGLVYSGMQYAFSAVMVAFLVHRAGIGAVEAGLILSAAMASSVFARLLWGVVADRTRADAVLAALGLLTAGSVAAAVFVDDAWPRTALIALGCWFGASGFSWNGVYLALVADIAGPARVADATSAIMTLVFVGGLSFPALFTALIAVAGYDTALLTVAAANAVTAVYMYARLSRARKLAAPTPPTAA